MSGVVGWGLRVAAWIDLLLQVLVPPRHRRVVWLSDPDYAGNSFHLFRHAVVERSDLEHVWLVRDTSVGSRIRSDFDRWGGPSRGQTLQVVNRRSPSGYWQHLRGRVVFHTHGVYPWVRHARRRHSVSLWHGMPIKAIGALHTRGANPIPTFGTLHLATSPHYRELISQAFQADATDIIVSGLPRCDVLHHGNDAAAGRAEALRALDVGADEKVVVWMPTYRARGGPRARVATRRTFVDDIDEDFWARLDAAARRHGCRVRIKLHPFDLLNETGFDLGLDNVAVVRAAEWHATGIELYDLLAHADGLMSDVSSVLIDWLPTGRPIGLVGYDASTYTRDLVLPVDVLLDAPQVWALSDDGCLDRYFDAVVDGGTPDDVSDLVQQLYPPHTTPASEIVLRAVYIA